jgi:hypothetical protein
MVRAPVLGASLFAVALAALSLAGAGLRAQELRTFIMPEDDGYGVGDCLAAGPKSGCGRIVADAWCESKGFAKAQTFGREDMADVTGSVPEAAKPKVAAAPGVITITCQN